MKVRFGTLVFVAMISAISLFSCKNNITGVDKSQATANISGAVLDWTTGNPLYGVVVVYSVGNTKDSTRTDTSGVFSFVADLQDTSSGVNVTLVVSRSGYKSDTLSKANVKGDLSDLRFWLTPSEESTSTSALLSGVVVDDASKYPLRGATIVVSLAGPGGANSKAITSGSALKLPRVSKVNLDFEGNSMNLLGAQAISGKTHRLASVVIDSTTTLADGSFSLPIPLYGLDSVSTIVTVSRTGYLSRQFMCNLRNGPNNLSAIPLKSDTSLTYAVVTGIVDDSLSTNPLQGVTVRVALPNGIVDSAVTLIDGSFAVSVNLNGPSSVSASLTVEKAGFNPYRVVRTLSKGENDLGRILLGINSTSTYAIITGIVRDSTSGYPLRGASVVLTISGPSSSSSGNGYSKGTDGIMSLLRRGMKSLKAILVSGNPISNNQATAVVLDSTTTLGNGSFSLDVNLYDVSSLSATMTVTMQGYGICTTPVTLTPGANDAGSVRLAVDTTTNEAFVTGTVRDSVSTYPLEGATVQVTLPGGVVKVVKTALDGTFNIGVNLVDRASVPAVIAVSYSGYASYQVTQTLNKGANPLGNVLLSISPNSKLAVVTGTIRDSVSSYPIGGATVIVSVAGGPSTSAKALRKYRLGSVSSVLADSTTSLPDGTFILNLNLYDLTSVGVTVTVRKTGYSLFQSSQTIVPGANGIGSVLLKVPSSTSSLVTGTVRDSTSTYPLLGATVKIMLPGLVDSTTTGADGTFNLDVNLLDVNNMEATVSVSKAGFQTCYLTGVKLTKGSVSLGNVLMNIDHNSTYGIITGVVRDSLTSYPLQEASVLVSLPGKVDSTTTVFDGSFSLALNLVDMDSIAVPLTVIKQGFSTYQVTRTIRKGPNNFGNIRLSVNKALESAQIDGYVRDSKTGQPLMNASVLMSSTVKNDSTLTLSDGSYSFGLNLLGHTSTSGSLKYRLNSYRDTTIYFSVNVGQTLAQDVSLTSKPTIVGGDSSTGRGVARSISLVSVSQQEISIEEVGKNVTSELVWQVIDSLGLPVDINHQYTVTFIPAGPPVTSGGAYVIPTSGVTNGSGQVSTIVHSGTVAGTIQLAAKLQLPSGVVVQSSPVLVTVDGGLPDQDHYELNSDLPHPSNFAGYDWSEVPQGFKVQAGDKFGNPVAPNTAIYFSTTGGIITAAGQTDATGHASATLYSNKPLPHTSGLDPAMFGSATDPLLPLLDKDYDYPNDPTYFGGGTGYAYVKASTIGQGGTIVADSSLICFSASVGHIILDGHADTLTGVSIPANGTVSLPVHISDRFGNPLESGTSIVTSVLFTPPEASGIKFAVNASGIPSTMGDFLTRGYGRTDYTLTIQSVVQGAVLSNQIPFSITILTSGRNGTRQGVISGWVTP